MEILDADDGFYCGIEIRFANVAILLHFAFGREQHGYTDGMDAEQRKRIDQTQRAMSASALDVLNERIVGCERCPRLRAHCAEVARVKRRQWREWEYWGKPVPSFGDALARVVVVGLAPGAHGSNRTGRPFTGDGSGEFLYPVLYETGFASQPVASSRDDGLKLNDMWITAAARCAPPGNKPAPEELRNCAAWLDAELALLPRRKVVVCLGRIALDACVGSMRRTGHLPASTRPVFGHGAVHRLEGGLSLVASYHPSLQNTNTGKLTRPMFLSVFQRARELAEA